MDKKYRYGHRPARRRRTRAMIVIAITLAIIGVAGTIITLDLRKNQGRPVEGTGRTVAQVTDENAATLLVNEPLFSLELPADWKEVARTRSGVENSVTWKATQTRQDNRTLKIYIDVIPRNYAVNRMLPLTVRNNNLVLGEMSGNCATFTNPPAGARADTDSIGKWQGVEFLCELGNTLDNQIGTSSLDGVNVVSVSGPTKGKHNYFFLYTDRNIQPDYAIFQNALKSFKAK